MRATVSETNNALKRIDKLIELKSKYEEKLAREPRLPARLQQVVVHLLSSPLITIPALAEKFGVSFPTASSDVRKLIELGILEESTRQSKPQYYLSPEFFQAAYSEG